LNQESISFGLQSHVRSKLR